MMLTALIISHFFLTPCLLIIIHLFPEQDRTFRWALIKAFLSACHVVPLVLSEDGTFHTLVPVSTVCTCPVHSIASRQYYLLYFNLIVIILWKTMPLLLYREHCMLKFQDIRCRSDSKYEILIHFLSLPRLHGQFE